MAKIDYEYETTEERVRAYLKVPEIDRLRWLEKLCVFTKMAREAPAALRGRFDFLGDSRADKSDPL